MICHVTSRLARAWAVPISYLIIIFLDFPSGESSMSFDKQGYDPPAGDVINKVMTRRLTGCISKKARWQFDRVHVDVVF